MLEHGERLQLIASNFPEISNNWVTVECNGLGTVGMLFPEFKLAQTFLNTAFDRLQDEQTAQVYADDAVVAIRDISPQAPTHILLLSRKHIASVRDVTAADHDLIGKIFAVGAELATREGIAEDGYRLVVNIGRNGGQTVDHLHVHLLGGRRMTWPPG